MQELNRRAALGFLLGGAVATASVTLLPAQAEALTLPKIDGADLAGEPLVEDAQYIIIGPRRRRRRRHCWRNRWGRVICR